MHYRYGKALNYAQDFATNPKIEPLKGQGDLRVDQGALLLVPGSSVTLPTINLSLNRALISFDFDNAQLDSATSLVMEGSGMSSVTMVLGGQISQENRSYPFMKYKPHSLRLSIEARRGAYDIAWGDQHFLARVGKTGSVNLRLNQLVSSATELRINSIVSVALPLNEKSDEP